MLASDEINGWSQTTAPICERKWRKQHLTDFVQELHLWQQVKSSKLQHSYIGSGYNTVLLTFILVAPKFFPFKGHPPNFRRDRDSRSRSYEMFCGNSIGLGIGEIQKRIRRKGDATSSTLHLPPL